MFQADETALYLATEGGHEECVRVLLQAGCNPNIVTLVELPLHPPPITQSIKVIHFFLLLNGDRCYMMAFPTKLLTLLTTSMSHPLSQ